MAMSMYRARAALLAFALFGPSLCGPFVAAAVPVPALIGHVTDQTATLTAEQKAALGRPYRCLKPGRAVSLQFS